MYFNGAARRNRGRNPMRIHNNNNKDGYVFLKIQYLLFLVPFSFSDLNNITSTMRVLL